MRNKLPAITICKWIVAQYATYYRNVITHCVKRIKKKFKLHIYNYCVYIYVFGNTADQINNIVIKLLIRKKLSRQQL